MFTPVIFSTWGEETCHHYISHSIHPSLPLQIFTFVTSHTQESESTSLPALMSPCLPKSIYISSPGCCQPSSPPLALSFHSCFHPSGSIPLSQRAGNSREQTGRRTARDGDRLWGFLTRFCSLTPSHQISISFSLMR